MLLFKFIIMMMALDITMEEEEAWMVGFGRPAS
jgi:hypothetical protein